MSKAIGVQWNEKHFIDDITGEDCQWAAWLFVVYGTQNCGRFWGTVRDLMLAGFCLLFFVGCSSTPKFTVETITPDQFTVTVEGFTAKQDDTITAVKANTEAIEKIVVKVQSLEGAILETRESLEASLVKSEAANSQEVIQESKAEPSDKNANDSQPAHGIVAESEGSVSSDEPSAVPIGKPYLQVWSASWCVYCPATMQAAQIVAKEFGINCHPMKDKPKEVVEACQITAYPTITLCRDGVQFARLEAAQDKDSIRKWLREQGLNPVEFPQAKATPQTTTQNLVELHNSLHGGGYWSWPGDLAEHLRNTHGVMVDGAGPYYSGNQVVSSRNVVRSVSRGPVVNWRSRSVSRASCPSGTCPR